MCIQPLHKLLYIHIINKLISSLYKYVQVYIHTHILYTYYIQVMFRSYFGKFLIQLFHSLLFPASLVNSMLLNFDQTEKQ